jgi:hypothetical protein
MASSGKRGLERIDISCILECDETTEKLVDIDSKLWDKDGSNHTDIYEYTCFNLWMDNYHNSPALWKFMVM